MGLMRCQDAYFPVLAKEERTTIALSAYIFFLEQQSVWGGASGLQETGACSRKIKKPFMFSKVDNIKCVACAHLIFAAPKSIKAPGAPTKHWRHRTQCFSLACPSLSRWRLSLEMPVVRPRRIEKQTSGRGKKMTRLSLKRLPKVSKNNQKTFSL